MAEFKSYRSYRDFAQSVTGSWRYFRSTEQLEFLETLCLSSGSRVENVAAGTILWRSQVGHDWRSEEIAPGVYEECPAPFKPDRMKPLKDRAREGRANAKGIPYLYVATHQKTAIAEVRPWIGALVTISQLAVRRALRVLNCTNDERRTMIYFAEPEAPEREKRVWQDIDDAFLRPVNPSDNLADYAPTQIIAEFFRQDGFDGIGYRSSLGPGHNIALFDIDAANVKNCSLVEITHLSLKCAPVR